MADEYRHIDVLDQAAGGVLVAAVDGIAAQDQIEGRVVEQLFLPLVGQHRVGAAQDQLDSTLTPEHQSGRSGGAAGTDLVFSHDDDRVSDHLIGGVVDILVPMFSTVFLELGLVVIVEFGDVDLASGVTHFQAKDDRAVEFLGQGHRAGQRSQIGGEDTKLLLGIGGLLSDFAQGLEIGLGRVHVDDRQSYGLAVFDGRQRMNIADDQLVHTVVLEHGYEHQVAVDSVHLFGVVLTTVEHEGDDSCQTGSSVLVLQRPSELEQLEAELFAVSAEENDGVLAGDLFGLGEFVVPLAVTPVAEVHVGDGDVWLIGSETVGHPDDLAGQLAGFFTATVDNNFF